MFKYQDNPKLPTGEQSHTTPDTQPSQNSRSLDEQHQLSDADGQKKTMVQKAFAERLRQVRLSFNLAFLLITVSASITFVGVGLLLSGKVSEGSTLTAGGVAGNVVSSVGFLKLTKDANDRLDRLLEEQLRS